MLQAFPARMITSLLGIPFLGKYFARNDESNEFDEQTWIQSASTFSLFPMGSKQTSMAF
jgi:hypothetical protein